MAILEMPVRSDLPAYTFKITLDGTVYTLGFRYNERAFYWIMDIGDEQNAPIIVGIPVQTDVDILGRFVCPELPPGQFVVVDESGDGLDPDRTDFGNERKLLYLDESEFATA